MIENWFQYFAHRREEKTGSFTGQLVRVLVKVVFALEPLIPIFAAYFLNRQLKSWEQKNLIINHTVQIKRTARFCYEINVRFVLGAHQLEKILDELIKFSTNLVVREMRPGTEISSKRKPARA
jgi:hypothetical protein